MSEIPAMWLVHAVLGRAATTGCYQFRRVKGRRDW